MANKIIILDEGMRLQEIRPLGAAEIEAAVLRGLKAAAAENLQTSAKA